MICASDMGLNRFSIIMFEQPLTGLSFYHRFWTKLKQQINEKFVNVVRSRWAKLRLLFMEKFKSGRI